MIFFLLDKLDHSLSRSLSGVGMEPRPYPGKFSVPGTESYYESRSPSQISGTGTTGYRTLSRMPTPDQHGSSKDRKTISLEVNCKTNICG